MSRKIEVNKGDKYGLFTVIDEDFSKERRSFLCKCSCGNERVVSLSNLRTGNSTNCGCIGRQKIVKRNIENKKHGLSGTRFYAIWNGMKDRCFNTNSKLYNNHGGRGITVCERWTENFDNFKDDMYELYLKHFNENGKNTSIERINVNGNYNIDNCKWATSKEQAQNRRNTVSYNGECASEAAKRLGGSSSLISDRIHKSGMSIEDAFTLPKLRIRKQ